MKDLNDPVLQLLSDSLDDLEQLRKSVGNRLGTMTRIGADKDGEVRGHGLTPHHPEVQQASALLEGLAEFEKQQVKQLEKRVKDGAFGEFIRSIKGLGYKQAARLISVIGDPYMRPVYEKQAGQDKPVFVGYAPRTVSQLWAYCGYRVDGGHAQRRRRGEKANWNSKAKSRAFLIAEALIKGQVRSPGFTAEEKKERDAAHPQGYDLSIREALGSYGAIYLAEREYLEDAVHPHECVQCGPAGRPAQPGSPLSNAHKAARAKRKMAKELLKDLWVEGRRLHGVSDATPSLDGRFPLAT